MFNKSGCFGKHYLVQMVALLSALFALVSCNDDNKSSFCKDDDPSCNSGPEFEGQQDDADGIKSLLNQSCGVEQVYESCALSPSLFKRSAELNLYDILGATIIDKGVNFAVFAKNATRVEILIFDSKNPDTDVPLKRIPMVKDNKTGIWSKYVYGVGAGTHYGYIAFGPNWTYDPEWLPGSPKGFVTDCDENGNRYNPNKLLMDPYTRRIHRDFDWMAGGNPASGTARLNCDWKSSPKSVVIKSEYQWSEHETEWRNNRMKGDGFKGHAQNDLIFYEVHPMGFTKAAYPFKVKGPKGEVEVKVDNPGTFRGIGEMAPYLADLGITAIELMPPMEKPDDGGYWGYNTINFFAPEVRFGTESSVKVSNGVHDEFKEMVDKLHQAGIEVILDIVYNHTGEGGFWQSKVKDPAWNYGAQNTFEDKTAATLYSFRGLDNKAYYHLIKDNEGNPNRRYLDETGVGNQPRANVLPYRRFILDNLRFWVDEMHVDGFRFDLASILGVHDDKVSQDGDAMNFDNVYWAEHIGETVLQDIIDDDLMAKYHTRFIAEPWSLAQYVNGLFPKSTKHENHAWFEWNGRYRDLMRRFVNNTSDNYKFNDPMQALNIQDTLAPYFTDMIDFGNIMTGSSAMFGENWDGRKPYNSVNILTVHDGFTLYDLNSYFVKNNECSLLNPTCCTDPYNAFCKTDSGESKNLSNDYCGGNKDSAGTCKDANAEAYKRQVIRAFFAMMLISHGSPLILGGDEYMRTQYGNNDAYSDGANNEWNWFRWGDWLQDSARVRMHDFVRGMIAIRKQYKAFLSPADYDSTNVQWHGPDGCPEASCFWNGRAIAQYYAAKDDTPSLFIMINMYEDGRKFYFPEDGDWHIIVDTQMHFEQTESKNIWERNERVTSETYDVPGRTIVIATK